MSIMTDRMKRRRGGSLTIEKPFPELHDLEFAHVSLSSDEDQRR